MSRNWRNDFGFKNFYLSTQNVLDIGHDLSLGPQLVAIFEQHQIKMHKYKSFVMKHLKEKKHQLFGVSISVLTLRDQQITGNISKVPLFLEMLLAELTKRGAQVEGILRIDANKKEIELLYDELEKNFYQEPEKCHYLLKSAHVHDLSTLLKRWLYELPEPLLTNEYIRLLYQTHDLLPSDQVKALAIICKMLPHENQNTLRSLLRFLNYVVEQQQLNKMNLYNVTVMVAPCLFQLDAIRIPRHTTSAEDLLKSLAKSCHLVNILIANYELIFQMSDNLIQKMHHSTNANEIKTYRRDRLHCLRTITSFLRFRRHGNHISYKKL